MRTFFFCVFLSFSGFLAGQSQSDNPAEIPPAFRLPQNHPGHGVHYQDKDFNYWRSLEDEEYTIDHDAYRFEYDYEAGNFDGDPAYISVVLMGEGAGTDEDAIIVGRQSTTMNQLDSPLFIAVGTGLLVMGLIVVFAKRRGSGRA